MTPILYLLQLTAHQFAAITLLISPPSPRCTVTISKPIDSTIVVEGSILHIPKAEPGLYSLNVQSDDQICATTIDVKPGSNETYEIKLVARTSNTSLVKGRLTERTSEEPAGGFTIRLSDGRRTTTADDGSFAIVNVNRDVVRFTVFYGEKMYAEKHESILSETESVSIHFGMSGNKASNSGLVAHYPFDQGDMADVGANSADGLNFDAVPVADRNGISGGALGFTSASGAEIPDAPWQHQIPMSVSFWIMVDKETPISANFLSKYLYGSNEGWIVFFSENFFVFGCDEESTSKWIGAGTPIDIRDGKWRHCVITVDTNQVAMHIDKMRFLCIEGQHRLQPTTSTEPISIGRARPTEPVETPVNPGFVGAIDDLRFYNRILSDLEIMQMR